MDIDLEKILQQNNELMAQVATMLSQRNQTQTGGTKEMSHKLKYGQGCITKRVRIGKKCMNCEICPPRSKNKLACKFGNAYIWYEGKYLDEYGRRIPVTGKIFQEVYNELRRLNPRKIQNTTRNELRLFGDSFMKWYVTFGNKNKGPESNKTSLTQINRVPDIINKKPLGKVTAQELQEHLDYAEKKYGGNPKWWICLLFKGFMKYSFEQGHIKINVGSSLIGEQPASPERNTLPRDLEEKFISLFTPKPNSKVDYRPYVKGLIKTGCRISEYFTIGRYADT